MRIERGMCGLKEAGILTKKLLTKRLADRGYYPCQLTPVLWRHIWQPITFAIVVDDFGIKCQGIQHAKHLKESLERHYEVTIDWSGGRFCGIILNWNYKNKHVDM